MWIRLYVKPPKEEEERRRMAVKIALLQLAAAGGWSVKHVLKGEDGQAKIIYKINPDKTKVRNVQVRGK